MPSRTKLKLENLRVLTICPGIFGFRVYFIVFLGWKGLIALSVTKCGKKGLKTPRLLGRSRGYVGIPEWYSEYSLQLVCSEPKLRDTGAFRASLKYRLFQCKDDLKI
jgi:hypothetical protein